jgi:hypothetical protein
MPDLQRIRSQYPGIQDVEDVTSETVTIVDPAGQRQTVARAGLPPDLNQELEGYARPAAPPVDPTWTQQLEGVGGRQIQPPPRAVPPAPAQPPAAATTEQRGAPMGLPPDMFQNPFLGRDPREVLGTIGGGMDRTTTTQVQRGVDLSEQQGMLRQSRQQQAESIQQQAEAQARGQAQLAEAAAEQEAINQGTLSERRLIAERAREEQQRIVGQIDELSAEIRDFQVDPDRLWKQKGTAAEIGAAIAQALGAFGAGLTGGPNYAMQIIQTAIDRDIQAQRDDIANKRGSLQDLRGSLDVARTITADEVEQAEVARILSLEAVKARAESLSLRTQSEVVDARKGELIGQLDAEISMSSARLADLAADRVTSSTTTRQTPGQQVTVGDLAQRYDTEVLGVEQYDRDRFVPRAGGNAATVDEAKHMRTQGAEFQKMDDILRELTEFTSKVDPSRLSGADRTRAKSLAQRGQLLLKSDAFFKLGILTDSDIKLLDRISPSDPESIFSFNHTRYKTLHEQLQREEQALYRQSGVAPVRNVPTAQKHRAVVPTAQIAGPSAEGAKANFRGL